MSELVVRVVRVGREQPSNFRYANHGVAGAVLPMRADSVPIIDYTPEFLTAA
jgi:hypothetical protein